MLTPKSPNLSPEMSPEMSPNRSPKISPNISPKIIDRSPNCSPNRSPKILQFLPEFDFSKESNYFCIFRVGFCSHLGSNFDTDLAHANEVRGNNWG